MAKYAINGQPAEIVCLICAAVMGKREKLNEIIVFCFAFQLAVTFLYKPKDL